MVCKEEWIFEIRTVFTPLRRYFLCQQQLEEHGEVESTCNLPALHFYDPERKEKIKVDVAQPQIYMWLDMFVLEEAAEAQQTTGPSTVVVLCVAAKARDFSGHVRIRRGQAQV